MSIAEDKRVGRIYICQPGYGAGHRHALRAFLEAPDCSVFRHRYEKMDYQGSALGNVFNTLWVDACNKQTAYAEGAKAYKANKPCDCPYAKTPSEIYLKAWEVGWKEAAEETERNGNITHWIMLHDDVVPGKLEDGTVWTDILMGEILKHNADVVSAVCQLKDVSGVTSTAVDDPSDRFIVHRRLTSQEVHKLPETFTNKDCGYPNRRLLINTGCWVVDFTKPWKDVRNTDGTRKVIFTISDRIRRNPNMPGFDISDYNPEDWEFSRRVQELDKNAKVMATRRVPLSHIGSFPFTNQVPFGELTDPALRYKFQEESVPPQETAA